MPDEKKEKEDAPKKRAEESRAEKQEEKKEEPKKKAEESKAEKQEEKKEDAQKKRAQDPKAKQEEKKKAEEGKAEKQASDSVMEIRDISIALDGYEDIFSDFDPRPFSDRQISADFLNELERRMVEGAGGKIELRFYIPAGRRSEKKEEHVTKRLQSYFRLKSRELGKEEEKRRKTGLSFVGMGLGILLVQVYFVETTILSSFEPILEVLLVPFGWFTTWVGLDKLFSEGKETQKALELAGRLSRAQYLFISEEENAPKESVLPEQKKQA